MVELYTKLQSESPHFRIPYNKKGNKVSFRLGNEVSNFSVTD